MKHKFKISCTKENLKEIRAFVTNTLKGLAIPEAEVSMMVLAVDEICANRIIHSNRCDANFEIELIIEKDDSLGVSFEIVDDGDPYDHTGYSEPNLDAMVKEKKKGGLGLMLVKRIMDSMEVTELNNRSVCKLYKKLASA